MDEDGEMYLDPIKGEMRPRRGKRKKPRRGPYSVEEKAMIEAWRRVVVAERLMDGELAQQTCADLTVLLVRLRMIMERYSWEATGSELDGVDRHVVAKELDAFIETPPVIEQDVDVYRDLNIDDLM